MPALITLKLLVDRDIAFSVYERLEGVADDVIALDRSYTIEAVDMQELPPLDGEEDEEEIEEDEQLEMFEEEES